MKLNFPALGIVLAIFAVCFLSLPVIGQDDFWTPPPLGQIRQPKPIGGGGPGSPGPNIGPLNTTLKIVSPAPNAVLKGTVEVKVGGLEKGGFAMFRLDDEFAYATVYPYTMRWDTQGAEDGNHIIRVTGYSPNGTIVGVTSLNITIKNSIPMPAGAGVSLEVRSQPGITITREIDAVSTVAGLGGDTVLPDNLLALNSRLFARVGQSISSLTPGGLVDIRSTIRQGSISNDKKDLPFQEKGYYGIYTQSATGLAIPPSANSRRPRIGLTEISLEVPRGKVRAGTSWVAPMRVIPDLVEREESLQVMGTHKFDGLWWLQNRKCARISSSYEIPEVALIGGSSGTEGLMEGMGNELDIPQPGISGLFSSLPEIVSGTSDLGSPPPAAIPSVPASGNGKIARLTGLSGTRTTWIDIEKGLVVRTEDDLSGTFVFGSNAADTGAGEGEAASTFLQQLPYNLSLTEELVK